MKGKKIKKIIAVVMCLVLMLPVGSGVGMETTVVVNAAGEVKLDKTVLDMYVGTDTVLQVIDNTNGVGTPSVVAPVSSNPSVASAEVANGSTNVFIVKALKEGQTFINIMYTDKDGASHPFTCLVTVKSINATVSLSEKSKEIFAGEEFNLVASSGDLSQKIKWKSQDTGIATVTEFTNNNKAATVKGVAGGQTVIYAMSENDMILATCVISVKSAVTSISITPTTATIPMVAGSTFVIVATIQPSNVINKNVRWDTSDPTVATVANGIVKPLKVGSVMITATTEEKDQNGRQISTSCRLNIVEPGTGGITGSKKVEGITFEDKTIYIANGTYTFIKPTIKPADASNKRVKYESLDPTIATVDTEGRVTGIKKGDTVILATTEEGNYTAYVQISVTEPVTSVHVSPRSKSIDKGKSFSLAYTLYPKSSITNKKVKFTSSNKKIATVDSKGKVTGISGGTVTIVVKPLGAINSEVMDFCTVKVLEPVAKLTLDKTKINMTKGKTVTLKAKISNSTATSKKVSWKSSNSSVAYVSQSGRITARGYGKATITCTATDGSKKKATCTVTVVKPVTSIRLAKKSVTFEKGKAYRMTAVVSPSTATIKKVKWKSSNDKIAKVDDSGIVTALAIGNCTITASATDGSGKKVSCKVKVIENVPLRSIILSKKEVTLKSGTSTKITARKNPINTREKIKWMTDDPSIAKVSSTGTIQAINPGTTNITVYSDSGVQAVCSVEVVRLSDTNLNLEQYENHFMSVTNATGPITWVSSNPNVATVDGAGKVITRSAGTTTITATYKGIKMTCTIKVRNI